MTTSHWAHRSAIILSRWAVVPWLFSLPIPALVLYSHHRLVFGAKILAIGWMSTLTLNFAWLANAFFYLARKTLVHSTASAKTSASLAFLFSLDTFRFNTHYLDEGGATSPVYGYGWGAILWLTSMAMLLVAAGTRELEIAGHNKTASGSMGALMQQVGVLALLLLFSVSVVFAIHDRWVGTLQRGTVFLPSRSPSNEERFVGWMRRNRLSDLNWMVL